MFSSKEQLERKTGPYGIGRFSYLQSLVTEFQDTDSEEAKEEVLANLANFAYDPINYGFLRTLNVIDLFLDCLGESSEKCVLFASGGLCNLALDKENKEYIIKNDGVNLIANCLSSSNEETVLNGITTMMFLVTPTTKPSITSLAIIDAMLRFKQSSNTRLSNLASVFLEDYCSKAQIAEAIQAQTEWDEQEGHANVETPLPVESTTQPHTVAVETGQ